MAASLAETSDPKKLIPGHPDAVRTTASGFTVFGDALVTAGEGLKRIDTEDGWKGNAADKFREAFDGEPKRWITSGDAFHDAAAALTSYAGTLEWAQGQAAEAATLWKEGQEATQQARSAHESAVQQALVSGSVPPQFHTLASVGNAVAHHPEDLLTVAAGAGLMALGGAGMTEGTGISLASGGTLAAGGVPLAVVSAPKLPYVPAWAERPSARSPDARFRPPRPLSTVMPSPTTATTTTAPQPTRQNSR
jgi:hypothetical protein